MALVLCNGAETCGFSSFRIIELVLVNLKSPFRTSSLRQMQPCKCHCYYKKGLNKSKLLFSFLIFFLFPWKTSIGFCLNPNGSLTGKLSW